MKDNPQPGRRSPQSSEQHSRYGEHSIPSAVIAGERAAKTPQRRGSLQWLALVLGALVGIILVIAGMAIFSRLSATAQRPSVAPIAHEICGDLTTQRYNDLYDLLTRAQRAVGSSDQFVASQRQLDAQLGTVHACTYIVAAQDASSATLTLTLARGAAADVQGRVDLTLEQNGWRIANYDSERVALPTGQFSSVRLLSNGG